MGVKFWSRDFWGVWFLPPFDHSCGLKSGVPLLGTAKIEKSSVVAREYGIGPRPFSFFVNEIKVRIDTRYAVWIIWLANVAPKSNLIQLGSAHEWSGLWTKPFKRMPSRVESICTSSLAGKMERVETYSGSSCLNFSVWERASPKIGFLSLKRRKTLGPGYSTPGKHFFFFSRDLHDRRLKRVYLYRNKKLHTIALFLKLRCKDGWDIRGLSRLPIIRCSLISRTRALHPLRRRML